MLIDQTLELSSLVPPLKNPFFIVSPLYDRSSAGITVLHLLCHYLNRIGENAFIVHFPSESDLHRALPTYARVQRVGPIPGGMVAPLITQDIIDYYDSNRLTPIVIYPEVYDNPLGAPFLCRYILNYPGLIAPKYMADSAYTVAYSKTLAEHSDASEVLCILTCDLSFWNTSGQTAKRAGGCFYAGKLKNEFGGFPPHLPKGCVEIPKGVEMSREAIRELFWKCEAFYCYEDTALAIEAGLCGCPVVYVPNSHFSGIPLASNELGTDGSCLYGDPAEFARAKATIHRHSDNVRALLELAPRNIALLARTLTERARTVKYRGTITYPFISRLVAFERSVSGRSISGADSRILVESMATFVDAPTRNSSYHDESRRTIHHLTRQLDEEKKVVREMQVSTSWRITAPLRALKMFLSRLRTH